MSDSPIPKPRIRKRKKSDLVSVPFFLYTERNVVYQRIVDIVGIPGTRIGQQVEMRHYISVGHEHGVKTVTEWMDEMNALNPTLRDKQKKRNFREPPLPIEEHSASLVHQVYRLYLDRNIPAERTICDFLDTGIQALCADYVRLRLPRKVKQIYLRTAAVYGIQQVHRFSISE